MTLHFSQIGLLTSEQGIASSQTRYDELSGAFLPAIELALRRAVPEVPRSLYDPVRYVLEAGGKRIRPLLTALAANAEATASDDRLWLPAATAIELLHTFTLIHDDIMDSASTRRGRPTAHVRYSAGDAILAGDVLIALAERELGKFQPAQHAAMQSVFTAAFVDVCEGQALDREFEARHDVTLEEYLEMIRLKTASILEAAAMMGSLAMGGGHTDSLRTFARHAGLAFQVMDDLLDLTAASPDFGKTIGGDILEGKRTYLLIAALSGASDVAPVERSLLDRILAREATASDVAPARQLFTRLGAIRNAEQFIAEETSRALAALDLLPDGQGKEALRQLAHYLLSRNS